jgi:hypothetical protein
LLTLRDYRERQGLRRAIARVPVCGRCNLSVGACWRYDVRGKDWIRSMRGVYCRLLFADKLVIVAHFLCALTHRFIHPPRCRGVAGGVQLGRSFLFRIPLMSEDLFVDRSAPAFSRQHTKVTRPFHSSSPPLLLEPLLSFAYFHTRMITSSLTLTCRHSGICIRGLAPPPATANLARHHHPGMPYHP